MNYLAHAYLHLDRPYFVAGTALPDWMSVIDRKNRARRQFAEPVTEHPNADIADLARGCLQHHLDDLRFHQKERFVQLSTVFAVELRQFLAPGLGHQAGFVGHISVELLLDSVLINRDAALLDRYYSLLQSLNLQTVSDAANAICRRPVTRLDDLIPRFIEVRFLEDYQDDALLLSSLNRVMQRIGLPVLPDSLLGWIPNARDRIVLAADELLDLQ